MALKVLFYEILRDQDLLEKVPPWYSPVMPKPVYKSEQVEAWSDVPVYADHQEVLFPIKEKLQEELNGLETPNIVRPVTVPNAWISATVIAMKKIGNIRLCVDPKPFNRALK
ncbi:hypothetical protein P5673_017986 [Acropora cervicornis]|uniref:Uncharacterized protein n=1 Tax=Acropora cervicornis TaxID=6130 RepID=A0AAD9V314_ACRCE|nr:hypothetical protein P5673_017986 [Acropora cervicornis]